jgi:hypothetical protein
MVSPGEANRETPILVELVDDTPGGRSNLGEAFRTWSRAEDVRVLFTPDVLIAVSSHSRRGYLYDDGWTVECWIERGVHELREALSGEFGSVDASIAILDASDDRRWRGLLELAIQKGAPIDLVRHLI